MKRLEDIDFGSMMNADLEDQRRRNKADRNAFRRSVGSSSFEVHSKLATKLVNQVVCSEATQFSPGYFLELLGGQLRNHVDCSVPDEKAGWCELFKSTATFILEKVPPDRRLFELLANECPEPLRRAVTRDWLVEGSPLESILMRKDLKDVRKAVFRAVDREDLCQYLRRKTNPARIEQILSGAETKYRKQIERRLRTLGDATVDTFMVRQDYWRCIGGLPREITSLPGKRVPNHYAILGVPRNASNDMITTSHRLLALAFHPDRSDVFTMTPEEVRALSHEFSRIQDAYVVLEDIEEKRKEYDEHLPCYAFWYPREAWYYGAESIDSSEGDDEDDIDLDAIWGAVLDRLEGTGPVTPGGILGMLRDEVPLDQSPLRRAIDGAADVLRVFDDPGRSMRNYRVVANDLIDSTAERHALRPEERELLANAVFHEGLMSGDEVYAGRESGGNADRAEGNRQDRLLRVVDPAAYGKIALTQRLAHSVLVVKGMRYQQGSLTDEAGNKVEMTAWLAPRSDALDACLRVSSTNSSIVFGRLSVCVVDTVSGEHTVCRWDELMSAFVVRGLAPGRRYVIRVSDMQCARLLLPAAG
ncbi:J domain-containing protein [Verrucomicrobiota bacterium]